MLQNKIKIYGLDGPPKNSSRNSIYNIFNILNYVGTNKLLYYLSLPGFILGAAGLYMGFTFMETIHQGGNIDLGYVTLAVLLTLAGTFLAFTGILLNSIAGLIKFRSKIGSK